MSERSAVNLARVLNLLVPGGGLVLIGSVAAGIVVAILFTLSANIAVFAAFYIPDDFTPVWRGLAIGVTVGGYFGAQIRFAQTLREAQRRDRHKIRDAALRGVRAALKTGDAEQAWEALASIRHLAEDDLLIAYRTAQVLTARGDAAAAHMAWRRVERLDHHHIYRDETRGQLRILRDRVGAISPSDG